MNKPKYATGVYRFGKILDVFLHDEDDFSEPYWSYKFIRAGRQHAFWYAEDEIEYLEKEIENID